MQLVIYPSLIISICLCYLFPGTRHILTPLALSHSMDGSQGRVDVSLALPPTAIKHHEGSVTKSSSTRSLTRCSIITVCDTTEDLALHQRLDRQHTVFSTDAAPASSCSAVDCSISNTADRGDAGGGGTASQQGTLPRKGTGTAQPLLAQDDLRAYAYEGDGSPSGSLSSTVLGDDSCLKKIESSNSDMFQNN